MRNNSKKRKQAGIKEKLIVGGVVVTAISILFVLVLLFLDYSNQGTDSQALNDALNGEYVAEENVPEELETENASSTENPYYQYEGELSDTPITPTSIENENILDYFGDDELKTKFKEEIMNYVVEYSKQWPVYANPTIIPGCEPVFNTDAILVDIHAADNRIINFSLSKENETEILVRISYLDDDHWPIIYDGLYIINSSIIHTYLIEYTGLSEEEANSQELEMLKLIKKALDDRGYTEEMYAKTPYIYLNDWESIVDENNNVISNSFTYCASAGICHPYIRMSNSTDVNDGAYSVVTHYILELRKEKRNTE